MMCQIDLRLGTESGETKKPNNQIIGFFLESKIIKFLQR